MSSFNTINLLSYLKTNHHNFDVLKEYKASVGRVARFKKKGKKRQVRWLAFENYNNFATVQKPNWPMIKFGAQLYGVYDSVVAHVHHMIDAQTWISDVRTVSILSTTAQWLDDD